MTDSDFQISVLIPAYNAEKYIAESIDSVLAQSYQPAEIHIIDGGPTEETREIIKTYGDSVIYHGPNHLGFIGARNFLLDQANFDWIAFHDADDIWMPEKLEKQVAYPRDNPGLDGCLVLAEQFLETGCTLPPSFRQELLGEPSAQFFIPSLLTSRRVFHQVGRFGLENGPDRDQGGSLEQQDPTGADSDWFVRAKDAGIRIGLVEEMLYRRRWHETNLTYRFDFQNNMLDILRRSIQRKRHERGSE